MAIIDARASYTDQLRYRYTPKTPLQLEWEAEVRPQAEALLQFRGEPLVPDSSQLDKIKHLQDQISMRTMLDGVPITRKLFTREFWNTNFFISTQANLASIDLIQQARSDFVRLPFRKLELPSESHRGSVTIESGNSVERTAAVRALEKVVAEGKGTLPTVAMNALELSFHRSSWDERTSYPIRTELVKRVRVISPVGRGYQLTDRGVELPKYARDQIEDVVTEIAARTKK